MASMELQMVQPQPTSFFLLCFESGSCCVNRAGFQLLGSRDSPVCLPSAVMTDVHHRPWLQMTFCCNLMSRSEKHLPPSPTPQLSHLQISDPQKFVQGRGSVPQSMCKHCQDA
jgi:hypothetical protein